MSVEGKVPHGTARWFEMVGTVMLEAATDANLPPDLNVSLVERYTDGVEISPGFVQGLRFEIKGGRPSFRVGTQHDEQGNVTVEVTVTGSHTLNTLRGEDPDFAAAMSRLQATGELKIEGDLSQLGDWFGAVHDRIVDQTG